MPTIMWNNYLKMRKTQPKPIKLDSRQGSVHFICYPKPKKEEKQDENTRSENTDKQTV